MTPQEVEKFGKQLSDLVEMMEETKRMVAINTKKIHKLYLKMILEEKRPVKNTKQKVR